MTSKNTMIEKTAEVEQSETELINSVVRRHGGDDGYKTPAIKRIKNSKFTKMISKLDDQELKALGFCLLISTKTKEAIDCFSQSPDNKTQLMALEIEYKRRNK